MLLITDGRRAQEQPSLERHATMPPKRPPPEHAQKPEAQTGQTSNRLSNGDAMNPHDAITVLLIALEVTCLAGFINNLAAARWVREEIDRKFHGERRVTPLWVKPLWGRWIANNLDGE